jgi:hemolysin activation/secretion protein
VVTTLSKELTISGSLEYRHDQAFIFGEGVGLAPGVEADGTSSVTVVRLVADYLDRSRNQVLAARSTFSKGIDAFGATINDRGPDGRFLSWLGQVQIAKRFASGNQLIVRADAQLAANKLLTSEKLGIGGALTVRGYRENQFVGDNGVVFSLEFRVPVGAEAGDGRFRSLQIAPFADWGRSWNGGYHSADRETISSVGVGLRWDPNPALHAEIYWAHPFEDVRVIDESIGGLQDDGVTFLFSYRAF